MALKEYKVFVRQNSTATLDYLITKYKKVMNSFMIEDKNIDEKGNYIYIYYAQIIDTRTNKIYMVFCDYGTMLYQIENYHITQDNMQIKGVIDTTPFISKDGSVKTSDSCQSGEPV